MSKKIDVDKFSNLMIVSNFTKHAIKDFEQNIVNQRDYLEKVKDKRESRDLE